MLHARQAVGDMLPPRVSPSRSSRTAAASPLRSTKTCVRKRHVVVDAPAWRGRSSLRRLTCKIETARRECSPRSARSTEFRPRDLRRHSVRIRRAPGPRAMAQGRGDRIAASRPICLAAEALDRRTDLRPAQLLTPLGQVIQTSESEEAFLQINMIHLTAQRLAKQRYWTRSYLYEMDGRYDRDNASSMGGTYGPEPRADSETVVGGRSHQHHLASHLHRLPSISRTTRRKGEAPSSPTRWLPWK